MDTQRNPNQCPYCGAKGEPTTIPNMWAHWFRGCDCGEYVASGECSVISLDLESSTRVGALLFERRLKGLPPVCFCTELPDEQRLPNDLARFVPMTTAKLLDEWPASVPEMIERCFLNICRAEKRPGHIVTCDGQTNRFLLFTTDEDERSFYRAALVEDGLVDDRHSTQKSIRVVVTPRGWVQFGEIERRSSGVHNPVFVAMWFGGKDRRQEMTTLFEEALGPGVKDAGYRVKRADTDEHNDPIMDRIEADVRAAPFVVAEFTENNPGVYFEAGSARGLRIPVIHCVHEDHKVYFDISAVSHVRYRSPEELRKKLGDRIMGSIGMGPQTRNIDA